MIIDYNSIFWGDSVLKNILITDDCIKIIVFNDVWEREVSIICSKCRGMTGYLISNENIIENVWVRDICNDDHPIINASKKLEEEGLYDCSSKDCSFISLRVLLINNVSFDVICEQVQFKDQSGENKTGGTNQGTVRNH